MSLVASVVIPTFRRPELLERCLQALAQQTLGRNRFEVIVCDDAADPDVAERCRSMARQLQLTLVYLAITDTQGPAGARNQGWKAARTEVIAFTDDDCLPERSWLEAGVAALTSADAVAGRVVVPLAAAPTDYERDAAGLSRSSLVTANCFCRRSALQATGGFDPEFRLAWREDSDLECRLRTLGMRLVPSHDAVIVHPVRRERFGVSLRQQRKGEYDALLLRRHPELAREILGPYPRWYLVAVALLAVALTAALAGRFTLALLAVAVWIALTLAFAARRLAGNSKHLLHVLEMVLTSAGIPLLSVYYRVRGWWRFRHCRSFADERGPSPNPSPLASLAGREI
jgi:glycosyltransferase involved in cell wall biosynthesis